MTGAPNDGASAMTVQVLIADDHAAIRSGLSLLLGGADDIEVVGEANDGATAVGNARALGPDVVLMDIRMPGIDGIEATRQIVENGYAEVLILTTFDLDEYVFEALRAGAAGFLLKTAAAPVLLDAVRRVAAGEGVLAPEVTRRLLSAFAAVPRQPETREPPWVAELTDRERDVLDCLARGLSNIELATELQISPATAKTHVSRVLAKLGATSRVQAAIMAKETGLG